MKNKKLVFLICLIFFVMIFAIVFLMLKNNKINEENKQNLNVKDNFGKNDTFSYDNGYGTVDVLGYVTIENIELYDEDEKINYVYFNIIDTKSNDFLQYIDSLNGNSFVSNKAIGLGCTDYKKIFYLNSSDEKEFENYELDENVSNKILASSIDNPIKLRLTRFKYSGGSGAPNCYSHISTIELLESQK